MLCCQQARKRITASINRACCMVNASPYLTGTSVSVPLATPATTARLIMVRMKYECVIASVSQIMKCSSTVIKQRTD